MTLAQTLPPLAPSSRSTADEFAERTIEANLRALASTQPRLVAAIRELDPCVRWIFARDGSLTCHDGAGRWWAGCSLPRRAGAAMLSRLEVPGVVGCLLAPGHAGEIIAALEKLQPTQAVLVVQPDVRSLRVALHCGEFAADLAAHRLWFAWGDAWEAELASLFDERPGLPTPERFIRTPALAEDLASKLIPAAEAVIANVGTRRAMAIAKLRSSGVANGTDRNRPASPKSLCVVAHSRFRLWDDAGSALAATMRLGDADVRIDPDDPITTSALALAHAAHGADAVVSAGVARAQLPGVVPETCPVLTWVTTPTIPAFNPQFPVDGLLLADPAWQPAARAANWPEERVRVTGWPAMPGEIDQASPGRPGPRGAAIAMLVDTPPLDTPRKELDLSSHHVLWEMIRADLCDDPFRLGSDVARYLARQRQSLGISEEGFSAAWFVERLVLPAYQRGLARVLLAAGLPLALYGDGWGNLPEFTGAWVGPLPTREAFHAAIAASAVVVYPWPLRHAHQLDVLGRPILSPGRQANRFLRDAKAALGGESPVSTSSTPPLARAVIEDLLR